MGAIAGTLTTLHRAAERHRCPGRQPTANLILYMLGSRLRVLYVGAVLLSACSSDPEPSNPVDVRDASSSTDAPDSKDTSVSTDAPADGSTSTDVASTDTSTSRDAAADDGSAPAMDGSDARGDGQSDVADASSRDADGGLPPGPMDATGDDGPGPAIGDSTVDGDATAIEDAVIDQVDVVDDTVDVAGDLTPPVDATADGADATADSSPDVSAVSGFPGSALVDAGQGAMINGWVGTPSQLWKLCYTTALHARGATVFHANCDFKGPSVTIAKVSYSTETRIIGGYNTSSWYSPAMTAIGNNAGCFLFSVTNAFKHDYPGSSTIPYFIINNQYYGPTFGAGADLYVHSQMSMGTCRPGYTYQCRVGTMDSATCNVDFCGTPTQNDYFTLDVLEVWVK